MPRRPRVHMDGIPDDGPSNGYVQAITDALGRAVEYDYDLAGRVVQQTLPDGREIAYGYDANGNVPEIGAMSGAMSGSGLFLEHETHEFRLARTMRPTVIKCKPKCSAICR